MLTPVVQRWREKRGSYRPAGETINPREYEAAELDRERAKAFVLQHHYLGCFPAQRRCFGLWWWGRLVGVAVFAQPMRKAVLKDIPGDPQESTVLSRLVLLDEVRANAESFFIARCFELLRREGFVGVVSFSDPFVRRNVEGEPVSVGHVGTIYQATNGVYRGRCKSEYIYLLPDGRTYQNDSMTKVRHLKEGWRYSAQLLVDFGAAPLLPGKDDAHAWLATWLPRICRKLKHPGNHKYLWGLDRRVRRHLPESKPYPKLFMEAR